MRKIFCPKISSNFGPNSIYTGFLLEIKLKSPKIRNFQNWPIGATCLRRRKVEEGDKWDFERLGKKYINKNKGFQKIPKLFFRHFFSIFRWRNLKILEIPDFWWLLLDFSIATGWKLTVTVKLRPHESLLYQVLWKDAERSQTRAYINCIHCL